MKGQFENITPDKRTMKNYTRQHAFYKAAWLVVVALVVLGLAYLIGTRFDSLWFATTQPDVVRKAIQLHTRASEVGASASAALEDGAYSYSVR